MDLACRQHAIDAGEPLAGTALELTTRWLLLEIPGPWAPKPLDSPGISVKLRAHLEALLRSVPQTRLQLIRAPGVGGEGLALKVVRSGLQDTAIHERRLSTTDELMALDIAALWEAPAEAAAEPLILVCAHGVRDRCCAREGVPVARALQAERPGSVWQTSHLGGHRFAATAVVLPWGLHLGRLEPDEAGALWAAVDGQGLHRLDRYRGCTSLPKTAQAAEGYLRAELGVMGIDAVVYLGGEDTALETRLEHFAVAGRQHCIRVEPGVPGQPRPKSCSAEQLSPSRPLHCRSVGA